MTGDRPDLPLAEEPLLGLRPGLTGTGALGGVQPAPGPFRLEEEPALWPSVRGAQAAPLPSVAPEPRRAAPGPGPGPATATLPATGAVPGTVTALPLLLAAALALRARRLRPEAP